MPLDLGDHTAIAFPALGPVVEADVIAPDGFRWSTKGPREQVSDAPLEYLLAGQSDRVEKTFGF